MTHTLKEFSIFPCLNGILNLVKRAVVIFAQKARRQKEKERQEEKRQKAENAGHRTLAPVSPISLDSPHRFTVVIQKREIQKRSAVNVPKDGGHHRPLPHRRTPFPVGHRSTSLPKRHGRVRLYPKGNSPPLLGLTRPAVATRSKAVCAHDTREAKTATSTKNIYK